MQAERSVRRWPSTAPAAQGGVPFDYVITAEQAQAYKPSRQLFEYA